MKDKIREFLENRVKKGQSEYEMLMDGYGGDFDEYFKDYEDDYVVVKAYDDEEYIHRLGYDEFYAPDGREVFYSFDYELVVRWETGDTDVYLYNNEIDALNGGYSMKMALGDQVSWWGVRERADY